MSDELLEVAVQVFDAVHDVPKKAQTAMALRAFGLSLDEIAKMLGYSNRSGVKALLDRHDPERFCEKGSAVRKLVLSSMFEKVGFEVLRRIKPEDLDNMPLRERIRVANDCVSAVQKLQARLLSLDEKDGDLLTQLKAEVSGE